MSEFIVEAEAQARDLFEDYVRDNPEGASIEVSNGDDGANLVSLVIENIPAISASLALLISSLKGRGIKVKVTRDRFDMAIGESGKV